MSLEENISYGDIEKYTDTCFQSASLIQFWGVRKWCSANVFSNTKQNHVCWKICKFRQVFGCVARAKCQCQASWGSWNERGFLSETVNWTILGRQCFFFIFRRRLKINLNKIFFLVFCLLTTFVFSGTLELSDCMIMKSFIQQIILLFYNVDY